MTFKADNPEQLSKWIAQLQSALLEMKADGDQVSVQGTEGGNTQLTVTDTHRCTSKGLLRDVSYVVAHN